MVISKTTFHFLKIHCPCFLIEHHPCFVHQLHIVRQVTRIFCLDLAPAVVEAGNLRDHLMPMTPQMCWFPSSIFRGVAVVCCYNIRPVHVILLALRAIQPNTYLQFQHKVVQKTFECPNSIKRKEQTGLPPLCPPVPSSVIA